MTDLTTWLTRFRDQHARAQQGKLTPDETTAYERSREQFTRSLLAAQGLAVPPGASPRRSLRIARACQVDLELPRGRRRCVTLDLGAGGFSSLLPDVPPAGDRLGFSLRLPGGTEPLVGRCELVEAKRQTGNYRCSFAFLDLDERTLTRLEDRLLDMALEQLVL